MVHGTYVLAVKQHPALETAARDQVVHAVEGAQHRRLATTGGSDEGRDLPIGKIHIDVFDRLEVAIGNGNILQGDAGVAVGLAAAVAIGGLLAMAAGHGGGEVKGSAGALIRGWKLMQDSAVMLVRNLG